ncbi:MAG: site-specific integrase [Candidatus Methanomethylicaceae archaeon]
MPKYKFRRDRLTTKEEVESMIKRAKWPWLKALVAFLYLYGCRVSEALAVKGEDVWVEGGDLCAKIPVLKRRERAKNGPYVGLTHILRVSVNSPFVKDVVLPYLSRVKPDGRLFPKSRQLVWMRLKELNERISPHVFRHDRLTKLAMKRPDPFMLKDWAGWSDIRPAEYYIEMVGYRAAEMKDKID